MSRLETLARQVSVELASRNITLAIAESCTGGLVGDALTDVPGASRFFLGGVTCYANAAKVQILSVSTETLLRFGAVSQQCAKEMLLGVKALFGSHAAIAITGIAGPDGGSAEKPVGTVFVAVGLGDCMQIHRFLFAGDRAAVKHQAASTALELLHSLITQK